MVKTIVSYDSVTVYIILKLSFNKFWHSEISAITYSISDFIFFNIHFLFIELSTWQIKRYKQPGYFTYCKDLTKKLIMFYKRNITYQHL